MDTEVSDKARNRLLILRDEGLSLVLSATEHTPPLHYSDACGHLPPSGTFRRLTMPS
jgi:hypothetical protein